MLRDTPIRKKLMQVMLLTSGAVLLLTCLTFFISEFIAFRQTTLRQLSTLGEIIATNSTAALAFDSKEEAYDILSALRAEKHIVAGALYDERGKLFSYYPGSLPVAAIPAQIGAEGFLVDNFYIEGYQKVFQGEKYLGMLYLKSDMKAMYDQFQYYGMVAVLVIILSLLLAYFLSKRMQAGISKPILALAETAKTVSTNRDYSVRAPKFGNDEIGQLTDSFNHMLTQIEEKNEEIISFNQKLEESVRQRTSELNLANKELEAFSYSISHDLRAPLRSINGYAQILDEDFGDKLDSEGKRVINVIISSAKRMGQLIDDLLDFSRMGRKDITKTRINMDAFVKAIIDELVEAEKNRDIRLELNPLAIASVDANMVRQVWINLVSNALKYSRKKDVTFIHIGCTDTGQEVTYFVKDNGAGFNMDYAHKLFGVFQRLHKESDFEGTGVGLALSKRIIERHQGRIWAESKPDQETTFFFTIPKQ